MGSMDANALREQLVDCTISAGSDFTPEDKGEVFAEYVGRAQPDLQLSGIEISDTAASLNSVSALANLTTDNGVQKVFLKIHVEDGQISSGGDEYKNGGMLADAGWPVVRPLFESENEEYPLLVYEAFGEDETKLFDVIERSYGTDRVELESMLPSVETLHRRVAEAQVVSLTVRDGIDLSRTAPLQVFFGRRLDPGARADKWFTPERAFRLTGLENPMTWKDLMTKKWVINGEEYDTTLEEVLSKARRELLFADQDQRKSYLVIAHGDDHPGNIVCGTNPGSAKVFDPASAGLSPGSMANAKALAHSGILPMSGMYYDPRAAAKYKLDDKTVVFDYEFQSTPVYKMHEAMAGQVINHRIIPVFQAMKEAGADIAQEFETLKLALAMCAFFTVDTAKLLEGDDNRGISLLPATIMLSQSRGLPSLDYLREQILSL